jgi:hypothetical protein
LIYSYYFFIKARFYNQIPSEDSFIAHNLYNIGSFISNIVDVVFKKESESSSCDFNLNLLSNKNKDDFWNKFYSCVKTPKVPFLQKRQMLHDKIQNLLNDIKKYSSNI